MVNCVCIPLETSKLTMTFLLVAVQSQGGNYPGNAAPSAPQVPTKSRGGQQYANTSRSAPQASAQVQTETGNANIYLPVPPTPVQFPPGGLLDNDRPFNLNQVGPNTIMYGAGPFAVQRVIALRQQAALRQPEAFSGPGSNYGTPPNGHTGHLSARNMINASDPYNHPNPEYDNQSVRGYFSVDSLDRQMNFNEDEIIMEGKTKSFHQIVAFKDHWLT